MKAPIYFSQLGWSLWCGTRTSSQCLKQNDGNLPICNNWVENQMRPWALGRKNWLFAGSRSGQRAANTHSVRETQWS